MSYDLVGPDTQGMGALNLRRGAAVVKRVRHTSPKRKAWGFYSGRAATPVPRWNTGFGSGFPAQVVTLGILPGVAFGAKMLAAPLLSKLFSGGHCAQYGMDHPKCSVTRLVNKAMNVAAQRKTAAAQLATRTVTTATPAPPAVMTIPPSAGVPVSAVIEAPVSQASIPQSMSAASDSFQPTDAETPAPPVVKGAGMFVPLAIGALVLFAATRKKR